MTDSIRGGKAAPDTGFQERRTMKKAVILLLSLLLLFSFSGCGQYTSSYKAVGFVHSERSDSASMSFYSFDGRMVFRLKNAHNGSLNCSASLETGNAAVYSVCSGEKTELFSISGGEECDQCSGDIGNGTVYVIVETDGKCGNGFFTFDLEK